MKRNGRQLFAVAVQIIAAVLYSCNIVDDASAPRITCTLKSVSDKSNLYDYGNIITTSTYSIEVQDNLAIKSVSVYVDDTLVKFIDGNSRSDATKHIQFNFEHIFLPGSEIRIVSTDFGDNESEKLFYMPGMSMETPVKDAVLSPSKNYKIKWVDSTSEYVTLGLYQYGTFIRSIEDTLPNTGSYEWTVPDDVNANVYQLRVTSLHVKQLYAVSNTFSIAPAIYIDFPGEGSRLLKGSSYPINWTGNLAKVKKIEVIRGSSFSLKIAEYVSEQVFTWTVPSSLEAGDDYRIRISSTTDPEVSFESEPFTVFDPIVTFTSPARDSSWMVGTKHVIEWTNLNAVDSVKIEIIDINDTVYLITASIPNTGSCSWSVPALFGEKYFIRLSDVSNENHFAQSDTFNVVPPYIRSLYPTYGTTISKTYTIQWNNNVPLNTLTIDLYNNGIYKSTITTLTGLSSGANACVWNRYIGSTVVKQADGYKLKYTATTAWGTITAWSSTFNLLVASFY